jgi:hypothetical protein
MDYKVHHKLVSIITELLRPLAPRGEMVDDRIIRLDLTPEQLRMGLAADRFAVGGAHSATPAEVLYAPNAIVPDSLQRLSLRHYNLVLPLLARPDTPHSLRIGFGSTPRENRH